MALGYLIIWSGLLAAALADSESVLFPSNERFSIVNETTVPDITKYRDPRNTGSFLYDTQATAKTLDKRLGMNILVGKFMSSGAQYFRAHPVFIKCAEQAILKLIRADIRVKIVDGFKVNSESDGSEADEYQQAGCGMQLAIDGDTGTVKDIAEAVLKACPVIVEREMRDVRLIIRSDRVQFYMAGPASDGPRFTSDGYKGISDIETWADDMINEGLEPSTTTTCENYTPLSSGQQHPANVNQENVVGGSDEKITREGKDFKRLVQYQGSNIEFENSECPNTPCPKKCATSIQGNSVENRCADRVMSQRLLTVLNKLQKKTRSALNDKLKVTEAWDEPYENNEDGDSVSDPLHYEGRAAKVKLVSGDSSKLGELSKYAICLGADYVEHRGDLLYISVKMMQADGNKEKFSNIQLLGVDAPASVEDLYKLPSAFSSKEAKEFLLFDSSGKLGTPLSSGVTIGQFVSPDHRYFRLNPRLLECYVDVVWQENKRRKDGDPTVEVEVIRGYMTNRQNDRKFDVINDKRYNTHNLGLALQLRYRNSSDLPATHTPYRLLHTVIDKCAPRFYTVKKEMAIGLYEDSVYVGLRSKYRLMAESLEHLPDGVDPDTFEDSIFERYMLARDKRVVDPEDYDTACLFQTAPQPKSLHFQHEHSEAVKRRRRRKRSADDKSCVPTRDTKFCRSTETHRKKVIDEITSMVDRKHYGVRSRSEIMAALSGCFDDCGTCMEGEVYDSKMEHCNNFLHWVDFDLINTQPDVTNFFVRSNKNANIHACEGGSDCVENSPLFSLVAPSVEEIYRPDPKKSVEEQLFSSANNPNPVFRLLEDMYAIQASGVATFWVKDDTEMTALKRLLDVVMLYNKNVTLVRIHVERYTIAKDAVKGIVEKAARVMSTQGCPDVSRVALTPYEVLEVPPEKKKRAAEPQSLRHKIRDYHRNFEARWAAKNTYL